MFSLRSLWLIFLLQTGAALEYPELYTHAARMGSSTTIPCKFNVDAIPPARRSFTMFWNFQEKEIFRSPNAPKAPDPRLSIDQDRIQDGIADLSMSRVSISDGGLYICSMVQNPEKKEVKEIRLDIHAPPQITITNKTALINKESVLRCAISGFYPVDIDIKWLRNGEMLDNVTVVIPQRGPDGTYSVNSSVTITPTEEDRKRTFSYRIQHESLTAPFQEDFRLAFGDEERAKQNILIIIISVSAAVGVVILIVIITATMLCRKRGGRGKDADKDQKISLVSGVISGDDRQPPDPITNTNEEFTRNQQHGPLEVNCSQMTGTNPATIPESPDSGGRQSDEEAENQDNENHEWSSANYYKDVCGVYNSQHSLHSAAAFGYRKYSTGRRHSDVGAENQDNENPKLISGDESGNLRGTRHSIHNTNKTSIRNQPPEPREERNNSPITATKPAEQRKAPDTTVSNPGDVRETRHSTHNTNETSIRNQQPEPREERNHSQMTDTKPAHRKPSNTTVSTTGAVGGTQHSFNKKPIRNQQPEPREEPNRSQMTGTRSGVQQKSSGSAANTPGDPSWENQRPKHDQTMPEDRKTKPSANRQEEEMFWSAINVKELKTRFQN